MDHLRAGRGADRLLQDHGSDHGARRTARQPAPRRAEHTGHQSLIGARRRRRVGCAATGASGAPSGPRGDAATSAAERCRVVANVHGGRRPRHHADAVAPAGARRPDSVLSARWPDVVPALGRGSARCRGRAPRTTPVTLSARQAPPSDEEPNRRGSCRARPDDPSGREPTDSCGDTSVQVSRSLCVVAGPVRAPRAHRAQMRTPLHHRDRPDRQITT